METLIHWGVKLFTEQVSLGKAETKLLTNLFREFLKADPARLALDLSQYEHPVARTTDPISSHEGVNRKSTKRQRETVLKEVSLRPGRTARELASEAGLDYEMVHKRLPELRTEEKLTNCRVGTWRNIRRCSITGRRAMEWWPSC